MMIICGKKETMKCKIKMKYYKCNDAVKPAAESCFMLIKCPCVVIDSMFDIPMDGKILLVKMMDWLSLSDCVNGTF